jgi:hypothetical protein
MASPLLIQRVTDLQDNAQPVGPVETLSKPQLVEYWTLSIIDAIK